MAVVTNPATLEALRQGDKFGEPFTNEEQTPVHAALPSQPAPAATARPASPWDLPRLRDSAPEGDATKVNTSPVDFPAEGGDEEEIEDIEEDIEAVDDEELIESIEDDDEAFPQRPLARAALDGLAVGTTNEPSPGGADERSAPPVNFSTRSSRAQRESAALWNMRALRPLAPRFAREDTTHLPGEPMNLRALSIAGFAFVSSIVLVGCPAPEDDDDKSGGVFAEIAPRPDQVRLAAPTRAGGAGAAPAGVEPTDTGANELATFYVFTRQMFAGVNLGTGWVLGLINVITKYPATEKTDASATWGPWRAELAPAEYRLRVTRGAGDVYAYVLEGRRAADGGDYRAVITGEGFAPGDPRRGQGSFTFDHDAADALDPARLRDPEASGTIRVEHDLRGLRADLEGGVLMRIDAREAAEAARAAEAQFTNAKQNYERQRQLKEQKFVSQAAVDKAKSDYDAAAANRSASGASQSHAIIVAPIAGVIARRHAELGDLATPGKPLFTLYEPGALRVTASVPQYRLTEMRGVKTARVEFPELGKWVDATAVQLLPTVDPATHSAQVRVSLPPQVEATPGMFARVHFVTGEAEKRRTGEERSPPA